MEGSVGRWIAGIFGAAMVIYSIVIRNDRLSTYLLSGGVAIILAVLIGPNLKRVKLPGVEVEALDRAEGGVSAELAAGDLETYQATIDSDDPGPVRQSDVDTQVIGGLNYAAGEAAIDAILQRAVEGDALKGCDLYLFLYDGAMDKLFAAAGTKPTDTTWAPGRGATGTAWELEQYVLAVGPDASDDTYGLTPEQQDRYRKLTAVASAPIFNAGSSIIGVLTATSEDEETRLDSPAAELELVGASLLLSRILIELLQWFDDGRQEA